MSIIATRNIIISDNDEHSIYRCTYMDGGVRKFITEKTELGYIYIITEQDRELESQGRHCVYISSNSSANCLSQINKKTLITAQELDAWEFRIYRPLNAIKEDMTITVVAGVKGSKTQLFGGLYSECETNAYESIKSNSNVYSEYISFYIPKELIKGVAYDDIEIMLAPILGLANSQYLPSLTATAASAVFTDNIHVSLSATFCHSANGLPGLLVKSNMTRQKFEQYYKFAWNDSSYSINDSYIYSLEISTDPVFKNIVMVKTDISIVQKSNNALLEGFIDFLEPQNTTYKAWEFINSNYRIEGTYKLNWDNMPDIIMARVKVIYNLTNAENIVRELEFISNSVTLGRDELKYILNKPYEIESIPLYFGEAWENYRNNYMLNINIVNKVETLKEDISMIQSQSAPIIYKPVFFKTADTSDINLIPNVNQRVGLNLQNFESKVAYFILQIGSTRFKESERTGTYVIFKINASKLNENETTYHILDQDSEYITSGKIYFT